MKLANAIKNPLMLISYENLLRRATAIVNLVLFCLLIYFFAELTWKIIPGPTALPPPLPADQTTTVHNPVVKSWDIAKWHLFGVKEEIKEPVVPRVTEIPETKLKLILRGIFASDDPTTGGAIIADPRNDENFYTVGAQVPGNATIKEIYPDRVVLMRNNQFETLRLPKESLEVGSSGTRPSSQRPSRVIPESRRPQIDDGVSLREYRDVLVNEPQRLAEMIQIEPVNNAGQFIGYRVQPGNDASFFSRFGLQPGDVVTAVNGITLDTPAKGLNLLRSLPDTNEYRIELQRNGQKQSFVINLND
jgi:general secretion pathway protein C